jgi:hypothetical protein
LQFFASSPNPAASFDPHAILGTTDHDVLMTIYLIARILWMIFYKAPARDTYKLSAMLPSTTSSLAFFCLEATAAILHANGDKFEVVSVGGYSRNFQKGLECQSHTSLVAVRL